MSERFHDRVDAGRQLGEALAHHTGRRDLVVLGLPRGGVPVAHEVARRLKAPLDVFVVRKLGVPGHDELAMGAIASGGTRVLNPEVLVASGVSPGDVEEVTARELKTLERQEELYRAGRKPLALARTVAIVVDDGLATGASMRVAIEALRARGVAKIVVAVPVAPRETCSALAARVDEMVCPHTPERFTAVGLWYRDFSPVSDQAVRTLLGTRDPG